mmetsp:Transcript_15915/g.23933  ORF Transcript_15915/g.23933 Transcript_15915/m.23933 type:complete len:468 (-) Transcript_15915:21-1424(-)
MNDRDGDAESVVSATIAPVPPKSTTTRAEQQMRKLRDANAKYKDLLKLAKERIQTQEEDLQNLKTQLQQAEEKASVKNKEGNDKTNGGIETGSNLQSYEYDLPNTSLEASGDQGSCSVVRVHQRIKIERDDIKSEMATSNEHADNGFDDENDLAKMDVWALIEYEITVSEEVSALVTPTMKRFLRWRRFRSESAFSDHIRRDSGEPISVPPYSLSPKQSKQVEEEARQAVTHVTEEFRRFRVRAEVARKQADATVRALQSNNVQNAQKHIEGQDIASELAQARTDHEQLTALKAEMAEQEAHWKSAYDVLLAENNQLKSSGSEALLAAQWRQRYEACYSEKEKLETALNLEKEKSGNNLLLRKREDSGKYEAKYKDLKESFRLYRKKAKEIFEAQQRGETTMLNLVDNGADDAKISYLRNLMVNYLSSDPAVREHMEGAIGTVLKFSSEDCAKISKQKRQSDTKWFS